MCLRHALYQSRVHEKIHPKVLKTRSFGPAIFHLCDFNCSLLGAQIQGEDYLYLGVASVGYAL